MSATCLFKLSSRFRRRIGFFPITKILLPRNVVILNQAFSGTVNEKPTGDTTPLCINKISLKKTFYRQYLLNNPEYANLIFHPDVKTNSKTAAILNQLYQEETNPNIYDELLQHFNKELSQFSFDELCEAAFLLAKYVRYSDKHNWVKILQSVNDECKGRTQSWTLDEALKIIDLFVDLPIFLKINVKLYYKILEKSLTPHQTVLLFYCLMRKRFKVWKEAVYIVQDRLVQVLPVMNFTEMGIVAEGFLKSFSSVTHNDFIPQIFAKTFENAEIIEQIPFDSICKFLRVMSHLKNSKGFPEFQEKATPIAVRFGTQHIINLALIGENQHHLSSNLRDSLLKEVKDNIRNLSTNKIASVAYIFVKFNICDEELLSLAVDELKSRDFHENGKQLLVLILSHLIHFKLYPKPLIDLIFEKEFVDGILKETLNIQSAWWLTYCSLEIEKPELLTLDLPVKTRKRIYEATKYKYTHQFQHFYSHLWKTKEVLLELFDEETIGSFTPLPHYPCGIIMRFDKNLKPQKLSEDEHKKNTGFVIKPLKDDHIKMFLIYVYKSHLSDVSNAVPNFILQTQIRQLKAVGYTPIVYQSWLYKNEERKTYLESLITAKLEECCKDHKHAILK